MNDPELKPCPFCGGGDVEINESNTWSGRGWSDPISVSITHHCHEIKGQPSRKIERVGRDRASAIAAWNMRHLQIDADWLSNAIREADGAHCLGAGALAEKLASKINQKYGSDHG